MNSTGDAYGVCHSSSYGPLFGTGHDLYIADAMQAESGKNHSNPPAATRWCV
jgi:hypothetical protein